MKIAQFLLPLFLLPMAAFASPAANSKAAVKEPLTFYLNSETEALNSCYTIEYYESSPILPSSLSSAQIEPKHVSDVEHLIAYLKEQLPEAEVFTDHANPKVIHITDKQLRHQKDYGLNQPINISYNGSLAGLPKAIGKLTSDNVSYLNTTDAAIIFLYAENKNVNITLESTSGREILTNATRTPGCSNELWQASSFLIQGKLNIEIYFPPAHN
jgi:hypothetical protein